MGGHAKGSSFERKICKILSLWWTDNEREDIFWRTAGSGAMAKSRSKKGSSSFGQYGDIQAVDPIGQSFLNACCIELKIGYKKWSVLDLIDKPNKGATQTLESFMQQVHIDCKNAKSSWPIIIAKRDRREPIIIFPREMYVLLCDYFGELKEGDITCALSFRLKNYKSKYLMLLEDFLWWCEPKFFKNDIWKTLKPRRRRRPI